MTERRARLTHIETAKIRPGSNVRVDLDHIDNLARSLSLHGMLQPITVVPTEDGDEVEVLFGHRRHAAAIRAGLTEIPCFLRERGSEKVRLLTQLAENRDREEMTFLDEALAYRELRRHGMSQREIGETVGRSQADVSRILQLLDYPDVIQQAVHRRTIGIYDAVSIPLDLARQTDGRTLAAMTRRGGRAVRQWVRKEVADSAGTIAPGKKRFGAINIDDGLLEEVRAIAAERHQSIAEWCERAVRTQLAVDTAAREERASA